MEFVLLKLTELVRSPFAVTVVCAVYIVSYYAVSECFFVAHRRNNTTSLFRKNGWLDNVTSGIWFVIAIVLIWSLIELSAKNQLQLGFLLCYYTVFIFLFAFLYGLLDWHFEGMIDGIATEPWIAEVQYLLFSVETITTLGHSRVKPSHTLIQFINAIQALLGLFFVVVFIAKAVTLMVPLQ